MILPQRAVFGDYSILFDVKSIISFRAKYTEAEDIYSTKIRTIGTKHD